MNFRAKGGFAGWQGIWLLCLSAAPVCVAGLLFHSLIKQWLSSPGSVACALVAGAICMILVDWRKREADCASFDEITPKMALGVGLGQCLALWPGFSRSAATIMAGLLLGMRRPVAVQFSFIAAVPVMCAASGYDLLRNFRLFDVADLPFFACGMIAAYLSALIGVRFFISLLGRITLIPFAIYRLAFAPLMYYFLAR